MGDPEGSPDIEPGENRTRLEGVLFGKGKDVPDVFRTTIVVEPERTGAEGSEAYREVRKRFKDRLANSDCIVSVRAVQDEDYQVYSLLMGESCRGLIIEDRGITSHGATLGRETIQQWMNREKKQNKLIIGAVENASHILQDGQTIEVDLSDPYHVKIKLCEESESPGYGYQLTS